MCILDVSENNYGKSILHNNRQIIYFVEFCGLQLFFLQFLSDFQQQWSQMRNFVEKFWNGSWRHIRSILKSGWKVYKISMS